MRPTRGTILLWAAVWVLLLLLALWVDLDAFASWLDEPVWIAWVLIGLYLLFLSYRWLVAGRPRR